VYQGTEFKKLWPHLPALRVSGHICPQKESEKSLPMMSHEAWTYIIQTMPWQTTASAQTKQGWTINSFRKFQVILSMSSFIIEHILTISPMMNHEAWMHIIQTMPWQTTASAQTKRGWTINSFRKFQIILSMSSFIIEHILTISMYWFFLW
jgi:hypothetical protein